MSEKQIYSITVNLHMLEHWTLYDMKWSDYLLYSDGLSASLGPYMFHKLFVKYVKLVGYIQAI